jgi:uncharacterized SAM-binding protein YcdF (DUF218 family)
MGTDVHRRVVALAIGAGVGVWIALAAVLVSHGRAPTARAPWDQIVVLGCSVEPDGSPSACLERRTRHAVALWHTQPRTRLVLTGGRADGLPAESEAAAALAVHLGVATESIDLETASTSTWENAQASAHYLDGRSLLVTDDFHAWRSARVFRCVTDPQVSTVRAEWWETAYGALREVLAVTAYAARGRLSCASPSNGET